MANKCSAVMDRHFHFFGCTHSLTNALVVTTLLASSPAWAQVLISPTTVELRSGLRQRGSAVSVTLSDSADNPVRLQAELLRWKQDIRGQALTEPSDILLVTPPVAEIKPGDTQIFRLALRGTRPSPEELAFRLNLEDIAEPIESVDAESDAVIKVRMRYDLPILLAPEGPVVNALRWKPCPPDEAATSLPLFPSLPIAKTPEACVRLMNAGNRHVKVQVLTLKGDNWQQALSLKDGDNVLAGDEREWRVPLDATQTGTLRGVAVKTAQGETLQAETGGF